MTEATLSAGQPVVSEKWVPEFDNGRAWRARLGFVLISDDHLIEEDVIRMAPEGVNAHFTRAPMPVGCTVENLAAMEGGLAASAAELLPGFDVSVVCYGCTSGTATMGEETVIRELKRARPDRQATTLLTGVIQGLRALSAKKIVMGTPYTDEVTSVVSRYMQKSGFELLNVQGLNLVFDRDITRVTPGYIRKFAKEIDRPDADAIFLSCGGFRAIDVIDQIEQDTGKPVVTSNQAMMWNCLRLAGINDQFDGYGRLLRER
ncbi:maleate cis-trans isomerase family protein [Paraburkholderia aspalathi]|uniref:Maleate isomerase n=1 Tax=Paraburkholderia aspalathi TaxID=1324617 RepID=A0A1I7BEU8_9BURK|nr:arylmalonate decarboxylase [Paraburkholderia aspalathi]SFT85631.1 maleate isomerase [Paraburkholderia aspalathi]